MPKANSLQTWIDNGYTLFAREGLEGIQVERLARISTFNKSGFYHYFGDRDTYLEQLMNHHYNIAKVFAQEAQVINQFDPDFIHLLLRHSNAILAHRQLVRNRHLPFCAAWYDKINDLVDKFIVPKWAEFLGMDGNIEYAARYFDQVRDMFYARITADNFHEEFLRALLQEARSLILDLSKQKLNHLTQ